MIPLRDVLKSRTTPGILYILLGVNIIVFFYQFSLGPELMLFFFKFGVVPKSLSYTPMWESRGLFGQLLPFFTALFLHGDWLHILGNMWTLYIFGDNVEDRMGHGRFIIFYLLGGFVSLLVHVLTNWDSINPTIGASGAIACVMGAYLVYFPKAKIVTLIPIFFYFTIITVPAYFFLILWFGLQFLSGTFAMAEGGAGAGIAWWAHIGGFLFGVLLARVFDKRRPIRPTAVVIETDVE